MAGDVSSRTLGLLAIIVLSLVLSGCGRKSPPVPPGTLIPSPPSGLEYRITQDWVQISWDVPTKNVDGSPIFGLKGFEVLRAQEPVENACNECPKRYESPIWIPFKGKLKNGLRMTYEDHTVSSEKRYFYAIRTVKGIFSRSRPSKKLVVEWHAPPSAPKGLVATRKNGKISLGWKRPEQFLDRAPLGKESAISYKIYRRKAGERGWILISSSVEHTSFEDTPTPFDQDYEYRVVPVFTYYSTKIPGEAALTTSYVLQPWVIEKRPRGLVAVPRRDGIELHWEAALEDGEGFRIYRKGPSGLVDTVNKHLIKDTSFLDTTLLKKGTYTYWVTIVKEGKRPLEGPPSRPVTVVIEKGAD